MKKISLVGCSLNSYGNLNVPSKKLKELNITEDEPFELVGYAGDTWAGKIAIVREFYDNDYQTAISISEEQAYHYFNSLFKSEKKKKEYLIMEKKYEFTPQLAFANIETHMKMWAEQTNAKNFVVGISGGKDSTVVVMLLCAIFGKERVYGVMMPQGMQPDIQDSIDVCDILGIHPITIDVGESVASITSQIWYHRSESGIYPTKDMEINLPARIRMATLHAVGQCVDGRVINTSNLSEDMVGYATQFGDNAGAYAPLQGLTVTEVMALGDYVADMMFGEVEYVKSKDGSGILVTGDGEPIVVGGNTKIAGLYTVKEVRGRLHTFIHKTPVDGLQAQTDEERLGFTYADLDKFIRLDEGSDEFKEMIRKKYKQNKFKLEIVQMPQPDFSYLPNFVSELQ